jgi:hypothetical protein
MDLSTIQNLPHLISGVWFNLFHFSVICFCIAAFKFQMIVLEENGSRFLKNLLYCYFAMGVLYLIRVLFSVAVYLFATKSNTPLDIARTTIENLVSMGDLVDTIISLISSYFMLRVWYLLKGFPRQQITKEWTAITQTGLTMLMTFTIFSVIDKSGTLAFFMSMIDVLFATVILILVGHAFAGMKENLCKIHVRSWVKTVKRITFLSFAVWGLLQVPYLLVLMENKGLMNLGGMMTQFREAAGPYAVALMVLKLICAMCAVIFGVLFIEDKPRFRVDDGGDGN